MSEGINIQVRQSDIEVIYEGADISREIKPYLKRLCFIEHASGSADTISLDLADMDK